MKKVTKTMKKVGIALVALMAVAMFAGCSNSSGEPEQLGDGTLNDEFILSDWADFSWRWATSEHKDTEKNDPDYRGLGTAVQKEDYELVQKNEYFMGKNKNLRIVHHYAGHDKTTTKTVAKPLKTSYDKPVDGGIEIKADSISIETSNGKPLVGKIYVQVYFTTESDGKVEAKANGIDEKTKTTGQPMFFDLTNSNASNIYIGASDSITITKIEVEDYSNIL